MAAVPNLVEAQSGVSAFMASIATGTWKQLTLRQVGHVAGEGVKIAGFFYVGECIGKRSLIGYQLPG